MLAVARWQILLAIGLLVLVYARSYGQYPYFDDWSLLAAAQQAVDENRVAAFIWSPFEWHWSPLSWAIVVAHVQWAGPTSDLLVRTLDVLFSAGSLALLAWVCGRLGTGPLASAVALAVLGFHHVNAIAIYSFDCFTQTGADVFTWAAMSLLFVAALDAREDMRRVAMASALMVLGLLMKETALAVVPAAFAAAVISQRRGLTAGAVIVTAAAVLFMVIRWQRGLGAADEGAYAVCVTCVPRNIASLVGALLLPTPVMDVYLAMRDGNWTSPWLLGSLAGALTIAALLLIGLLRADRPRVALAGTMLMAACFPVVLTAHVGELHARSLVFWFALFVALAIDRWRAERAVHLLALSYVGLLYLSLASNLNEMRNTSARSREVVARVVAELDTVSRDAAIRVTSTDQPVPPRDYAFIRVTSPSALLGGGEALEVAQPRPVLSVEDSSSADRVTVELDGSSFRVKIGQRD